MDLLSSLMPKELSSVNSLIQETQSSQKLSLPDVTLVMIETQEHTLARLAIEDCLYYADFGEVLVFTDKQSQIDIAGARYISVPNWPDKIGWCRCNWQEVASHIKTSYVLAIQWDSWIFDPAMWRKDYMEYDYVGAPWWYKDGRNVGNGGFCLKSTRLMRYLRDHRNVYPCIHSHDDDLLCRKYRFALEEAGFVWAPQSVAVDFAFECVRPSPMSRHFGFHGMFNWGAVLEQDRLLDRARIAAGSHYITNSQYLWGGFCKAHPGIVEQL